MCAAGLDRLVVIYTVHDSNPGVDEEGGEEEEGNDKTIVAGARTPRLLPLLLVALLSSSSGFVVGNVINLEIPIPSRIGVARNSGTGQAPVRATVSLLSLLLTLLTLLLVLSRQIAARIQTSFEDTDRCQTSSVFGLLLLLLLTGPTATAFWGPTDTRIGNPVIPMTPMGTFAPPKRTLWFFVVVVCMSSFSSGRSVHTCKITLSVGVYGRTEPADNSVSICTGTVYCCERKGTFVAVGTVVVFAVAVSTGLFFVLLFRFSFWFGSFSVCRLVLEADDVGNGICGRASVGAVKECRNVCSQSDDEDNDEEDANNNNEGGVVTAAAAAAAGGAVAMASIEGVVTAAAASCGRPPPIIIINAVTANMELLVILVSKTGWSGDPAVVAVFVVSVCLISSGLRRSPPLPSSPSCCCCQGC